MKIGTKGHYAVAAMMGLAKEASDMPIPLSILAANQNISMNYLELLFVKLKNKKLVKSVRGARGGYLLMRPASTITIWEIVTAVGEGMRVNRCDNSGEPHYCFAQKTTCAMHFMWEGLGQRIYEYLSHISLQALLDGGSFQATQLLKLGEERLTCNVNTQAYPEKGECQQSTRLYGSKKGLCLSGS